jgi:sulfur carrier protein ThiS adenylyltransferase
MAYKVTDLRSRFKDAPWANYPGIITIGGVGGIGSWTSFFLARAGFSQVIYDFDTVEELNLGGQLYGISSIGIPKTRAIKDIIEEFSGPVKVSTFDRFEEDSLITDFAIAAFDNMASRKLMFEAWKKLDSRVVFIDGRLLAETFTIHIVTPGNEEAYEASLFDDSEIEDAPCTFKSTTHCGAMLGTLITSIITNIITNLNYEADIRSIPTFISVNLPLIKIDVHFE